MHTTISAMRMTALAVAVSLVAALLLVAPTSAQSAVPFKAVETGAADESADAGLCEEDVIRIDGHATGTGTQLGRFEIDFDECLSLVTFDFTVDFVITAANGDTLEGSYAGITTGPTSYEATAHFTGGTGRFANASGTAMIHGTFDEAGYVQTWNGWISHPGRGPGR